MRHHALNMGETQGQGYVGQALGAADMLAAVYADQLRYRADDPHWPGATDSSCRPATTPIGLYAALAEAGIIEVAELDSYGSDGSRLPMSGMASYTPGMEISGGSLGHGLDRRGRAWRSDYATRGPMRGSSTSYPTASSTRARHGRLRWVPSHHRLGNLIAMVDINALQADGPTVRRAAHRPVADKWTACGWHAQRIDGNDVDALLDAFDNVRSDPVGVPSVILCDTRIGRRRAAARDPREGALHAHRRRRVADLSRSARRRPRRSTRMSIRCTIEDIGDDRIVRRPRSEDRLGSIRACPGAGCAGRRTGSSG